MRRRVVIVGIFLLAGAVVNVAVAWGCAARSRFSLSSTLHTTSTDADRRWLERVGWRKTPDTAHWLYELVLDDRQAFGLREMVLREERRERARNALTAVGLSDRSDHKPSELSGGQKQRIAIARATIMGPGMLLADEPTGNLDPRSGGQGLGLLEQLHREGLTLLVVTHDLAVARRADRVLVMQDGEILKCVAGSSLTSLVDALEGAG